MSLFTIQMLVISKLIKIIRIYVMPIVLCISKLNKAVKNNLNDEKIAGMNQAMITINNPWDLKQKFRRDSLWCLCQVVLF